MHARRHHAAASPATAAPISSQSMLPTTVVLATANGELRKNSS